MRRFFVATTLLLLLITPAAAQDICPGDTGSALKTCLQANYSGSPIGYNPARDVLYGEIDIQAGNQLAGIYTDFTITLDPNADPSSDAFSKGINAEHIVPQSKGMGDEPARGDMHNLYPTRVEVNSARGSLPFDDSPDSATDDWYFEDEERSTPPATNIDAYSERDVNTRFEPRESVKGDIARAVFYTATIWESRVDDTFIDAQVDVLLQWHANDPVTQVEIDRSAAIAAAQGNENPFVLDETLAGRAFGDDDGGGGDDPGVQTIAEARATGSTAEVTVQGTVTRAKGAFTYMQDDSGPTGATGLTIRQPTGSFANDVASGTIAPGTRLEITGTPSYFAGLFQVNEEDLTAYTILSQNNPLPTPQEVTLSDLQGPDGEDYEGELVTVDDVQIVNATDATFVSETSYDIEDPTQDLGDPPADPVVFRIPSEDDTDVDGAPVPAGTFSFTGVVGQFHGFDFVEAPDEGFQLLAIAPTTALPVELTAFDVTTTGTAATLVWKTASETNNAGFAIQHRAPGADAFARSGFVDGNGTTTQPQTYRFRTDALSPGTHTFRLKQVDTDGTTSLSPERTITVRTDAVLSVQGPNPMRSGQQARLTVQVDAAQSVDVALYNVLGQRVQTVFSGTATPSTPAQATLTTDRLPSGVYFVRVSGETVQATQQITVVR